MRLSLLIFFLFIGFSHLSYCQCDYDFAFEVTNSSKAQSDGEIAVRLNSMSNQFDFQLVNLVNGKVVKELHDIKINSNQKITLFKDLGIASYVIYVKAKDCDSQGTIGNKFGIIIQEE